MQIGYNHQNICYDDSNQSQHTKNLLPEYPSVLIFHPLEKEFPERIDRRFAGEAIINVLIVHFRFEPEFVGVGKEQPAEKQENEDKSEGWLRHFSECLQVESFEAAILQTSQLLNTGLAQNFSCFQIQFTGMTAECIGR